MECMFTGLGDLSLVIDPRSNICHSAPEKTADAISSNLIQENNVIFPRMSQMHVIHVIQAYKKRYLSKRIEPPNIISMFF